MYLDPKFFFALTRVHLQLSIATSVSMEWKRQKQSAELENQKLKQVCSDKVLYVLNASFVWCVCVSNIPITKKKELQNLNMYLAEQGKDGDLARPVKVRNPLKP